MNDFVMIILNKIKGAKILIKGSSLKTFSYLLHVIVAFLLTPYIIHTLGDRMFGFWTLVGSLIGYYGLLDFGFSMAVNRHIAAAIGARNNEECNRLFNTSFWMFSTLGGVLLIVTIILALLSRYIITNPEDVSLFWKVILLIGISVSIEFQIKVFITILDAKLRYDIMAGIQIITLLLRASLTVLVLSLGYKILALAWVTFLSGVPGKILYIYFGRKNLPFLRLERQFWNLGTLKMLLSFSSFAFLFKMADQFRFTIAPLVIAASINLAAVTHYKIAGTMAAYFYSLVVTMLGIFFPLFSQQYGRRDYHALKKNFFFSTNIAIYVSCFIGFGMIVWGSAFIELWVGSKYLDAYRVLVILTISEILNLSQAPSSAVLFATGTHKSVSICFALEAGLNLLLTVMLVRYFGLVGGAFGVLIPVAVRCVIVQPTFVCRVLSIRYVEYGARVFRTLCIVFCSLIIPVFISVYSTRASYLMLAMLFGVSLCLYSLSVLYVEVGLRGKEIVK